MYPEYPGYLVAFGNLETIKIQSRFKPVKHHEMGNTWCFPLETYFSISQSI
jgi:hypothetical protein